MCKRVPVGAECASMRRVGTPRVYLTIQVSDAVVAHLLARAPPLFADADTGFILGRGTDPSVGGERGYNKVMQRWGRVLQLLPIRDLMWTHDSMSPTFLHGAHDGRDLWSLYEDLHM